MSCHVSDYTKSGQYPFLPFTGGKREGEGPVWLLSKFQVFMESGHIPPKLELEGEGRGERPVSERILFKSPTSSIQPFPTLVTRPSNQSDYDDNVDDDDDYDDDDYDPSTPVFFHFFPRLLVDRAIRVTSVCVSSLPPTYLRSYISFLYCSEENLYFAVHNLF